MLHSKQREQILDVFLKLEKHVTIDDLYSAAEAADVKNPDQIIKEVKAALGLWKEIANETGLRRNHISLIEDLFRKI